MSSDLVIYIVISYLNTYTYTGWEIFCIEPLFEDLQKRGQLVLKRIEVIAVMEKYRESLLVILTCFLRFLEGDFVRKSLQNQNVVTDLSQKKLKNIIEYVSYSIRYCRLSLLREQ